MNDDTFLRVWKETFGDDCVPELHEKKIATCFFDLGMSAGQITGLKSSYHNYWSVGGQHHAKTYHEWLLSEIDRLRNAQRSGDGEA